MASTSQLESAAAEIEHPKTPATGGFPQPNQNERRACSTALQYWRDLAKGRLFPALNEVTPEGAASINRVNDEVGVKWLISFLSADKKKTYCLYEASNPEALREAAERNGVPADVIVEVGELSAMGMMGGVQPGRFAV